MVQLRRPREVVRALKSWIAPYLPRPVRVAYNRARRRLRAVHWPPFLDLLWRRVSGAPIPVGLTTKPTRLSLPLAAEDPGFCVAPFLFLQARADGRPNVCCRFTRSLEDKGTPLSLFGRSLDDVWNSADLRRVRRDMVYGRIVHGCEGCYNEEMAGAYSMRQIMNGSYLRYLPDVQIAGDDWRLGAGPQVVEVDVGNACNLKCRMCNAYSSSKIERDAVHNEWSGRPEWAGERRERGDWVARMETLAEELARDPGQLKVLHFLGGETLLIKEVGNCLRRLIDAGVAGGISLSAGTNATVVQSPWLDLVEHFQTCHLTFSIDGYGDYYEYIRYPAKWDVVTRNMEALRRRPKVSVSANIVFQIYNALNIVDLFRHLDAVGIGFRGYPLDDPVHLRPALLPARARRVASERLRAYAEVDCRPPQKAFVAGLANYLDAAGPPNEDMLRDFMLFTNDLDATRGQSFRRTHAELLAFLEQDGFRWTDETRHARRRPLPVVLSKSA